MSPIGMRHLARAAGRLKRFPPVPVTVLGVAVAFAPAFQADAPVAMRATSVAATVLVGSWLVSATYVALSRQDAVTLPLRLLLVQADLADRTRQAANGKEAPVEPYVEPTATTRAEKRRRFWKGTTMVSALDLPEDHRDERLGLWWMWECGRRTSGVKLAALLDDAKAAAFADQYDPDRDAALREAISTEALNEYYRTMLRLADLVDSDDYVERQAKKVFPAKVISNLRDLPRPAK